MSSAEVWPVESAPPRLSTRAAASAAGICRKSMWTSRHFLNIAKTITHHATVCILLCSCFKVGQLQFGIFELLFLFIQFVLNILQFLQAGQNWCWLRASTCSHRKSLIVVNIWNYSNIIVVSNRIDCCKSSFHALTSTQGSLWVKNISSKSDSLGPHLLIKSHFFGIVQSVTH